MLARLQALIRRSSQTSEPTTLSFADLTMDLLTREVRRGEKRIELQSREFALLEYLLRNRGRRQKVLANLEDNALKYTPKGGAVEIAAAENAGETIISVRDTGIGIPAAEIPRVWDRLYRGDNSRTEHGLP